MAHEFFRLGAKLPNRLQVATIVWDGKSIQISEGKDSLEYVELDARTLVGLLFGGPFSAGGGIKQLLNMLPVPIWIPD